MSDERQLKNSSISISANIDHILHLEFGYVTKNITNVHSTHRQFQDIWERKIQRYFIEGPCFVHINYNAETANLKNYI